MSNFPRHTSWRIRGHIVAWLLIVVSLPAVQPVEAQDEPPPRPTLAPTATSTPLPPTATSTPLPPTVVPTSVPRDQPADPTPEPRGRIIGTVIDLTTGAPTSNIAVAVGDMVVRTDGNGNYERSSLPTGEYVVQLQLAPSQGTAAQAPITVVLPHDATVVQHLAFRSVVQATSQPTAPTASPPPTATPAPTTTPVIVTAPPPIPSPPSVTTPRTLPAAGSPASTSGWLIMVACLLIALGAWRLRQLRHSKS